MRFLLAVVGTCLLFFYGQRAFAQDSESDFAYAVYCDSSVDRKGLSEFILVDAGDAGDDIIVVTQDGYDALQDLLGTTYSDHCGPGTQVALQ